MGLNWVLCVYVMLGYFGIIEGFLTVGVGVTIDYFTFSWDPFPPNVLP